ncbi:response regulator transcription factor [Streptomyces sp. NPDC057621]|uniref:Response regulator transcription factor n=1 Tax=Streptomyces liliiviolaceus TaxID=2823109 RepID=A0A940XV95_9ACTN|nr:response regulator transcription factor [Streptomyces liliiviolaceus]MBQ0852529.1 response regulator transcription factor [Streptomyces liliiviolaceus]
MNSPDTVLVVEDDANIRDLMDSALRFAGFDVRFAEDVPQALTSLARDIPDVIVLDVGLPGGNGFDVLQLIRARGVTAPVLFLTARDAVEDRVRGLRLGGDDYVTKPFSVVEVGARLQALVRRARGNLGPAVDDGVLRYADLALDDRRHTVHRGGESIDLSPTEYRLLHYLLSHPDHVMTRSQILEAVWQYDFGGDSGVVERFVSNLRRKLDHGREPLIHTVRGIGYSLRRSAT